MGRVSAELRAWASINLQALQANLARVREINPRSKVVAVIKANAYGHGMEEAAAAIRAMDRGADCLAVATMDEVVRLQLAINGARLLHLQGFRNRDEMEFLIESGVEFVVHSDYQLTLLKSHVRQYPGSRFTPWLKIDTGMHRLGFDPEELGEPLKFMQNSPQISRLVLMSHFACADGLDDPAAAMTRRQLAGFQRVLAMAATRNGGPEIEASLSASAAILRHPAAHFELLRPGIMLYGGSPFGDVTGLELGLRPVMSLFARIMAIRDVGVGETIGYGGGYTCAQDMRIGVVSVGYGDGFPRSAVAGTPVVLHLAAGMRRASLVGRVSMDMITIDLTGMDDVVVGDQVELWGDQLSIDEVAAYAGTISYELMCQVTRRVKFLYN